MKEDKVQKIKKSLTALITRVERKVFLPMAMHVSQMSDFGAELPVKSKQKTPTPVNSLPPGGALGKQAYFSLS